MHAHACTSVYSRAVGCGDVVVAAAFSVRKSKKSTSRVRSAHACHSCIHNVCHLCVHGRACVRTVTVNFPRGRSLRTQIDHQSASEPAAGRFPTEWIFSAGRRPRRTVHGQSGAALSRRTRHVHLYADDALRCRASTFRRTHCAAAGDPYRFRCLNRDTYIITYLTVNASARRPRQKTQRVVLCLRT